MFQTGPALRFGPAGSVATVLKFDFFDSGSAKGDTVVALLFFDILADDALAIGGVGLCTFDDVADELAEVSHEGFLWSAIRHW